MAKTKKKPKRRKKKIKNDSDVTLLRQVTIIAGLVLLAVLVGIGIFVTSYQNKGQEIDFSLEAPEGKITRSIPFEIDVGIDNKTESMLSEAKVTLSLEEGLISLGYGKTDTAVHDSIGSIEGESISKKTYRLLPTAPAGSTLKITGSFSYIIGETEFEKEVTKEIKVKDQALSVNIEKPEQILAGSNFKITVNYENTSDFDFSDLRLEMNYPENFTFISSDLEPDAFNNYWRLGALKGNSSGKLDIRGRLGSIEKNPKFEAGLFAVFQEKPYLATETKSEFKTSKSPVYLETKLEGSRSYTARIGDSLQYTVNYKNETGIALKDTKIKFSLAGELFDYSTLVSEGKFNSLTNTLTWDKSTNPELEILEPGEGGTMRVSVDLKSVFSIKRLNDKNFTLKAKTEMESPSVPYYLSAEKTTAGDFLKTKVQGLTTVDARGYYRDAASGIANDGPMPPKVGKATEYTIHWVVKNYSTDVEDVKISANLPEGVKWTGIAKSNIDSIPLYTQENKKMTWKIDEISATKGVISEPIEAIFQIEATPTENREGQFQPLLSNTTLKAKDQFTGRIIESSDIILNTSLPDDNSVEMSEGLVVE